jgi:hypothetical protein
MGCILLVFDLDTRNCLEGYLDLTMVALVLDSLSCNPMQRTWHNCALSTSEQNSHLKSTIAKLNEKIAPESQVQSVTRG